ncbi:MAG TPA: glycosyltransferase family 4 protein [Candidatus Omnitrophota bacterium]|nr:glycosyltransferase family 4 protein [Candidatus Omnitrophota bacterium]
MNIRICYLPGREATYSRTRVILKALTESGFTVHDCSYPHKKTRRYFISFFKFLKYRHQSDIIFVGFLGHFFVPFVRLFTKKKIIFDVFVSIYQTLTDDRKTFAPDSLLARIARCLDRLSCRLADVLILDTDQHIDYFVNELKINKDKIVRIFVGSDNSVMYPREESATDQCIVHFHGEFQPLHGCEYIIEAAKLVPRIKLQMIGEGLMLADCLDKAKKEGITNIAFYPSMPYEKLSEYMAKASICLGLFGNTRKTQMVIPHKVYEAMAMKKPIITAETPAIKELLTHEENVFLCKSADPRSLASAISELSNNPALREKLGRNAYNVFQQKCSPKIIGKQILEITERLTKKPSSIS